MRLLITRPIEDAEPLAAALDERGIKTILDPMMTITGVAAPDMDLTGIQALLVTSANGIRAFARCSDERQIPVCTVGDASADTARALGFGAVTSADGDVESLAALVIDALDSNSGALLHVAGSRVAGDLSGLLQGAGFTVRRAVLYGVKLSAALSPQTIDALDAGTLDGALLYSPRTAAHFIRLVTQAGRADQCRAVRAYCLSQAVADKAGAVAWKEIVVAPEPNQQALLDLISAHGA